MDTIIVLYPFLLKLLFDFTHFICYNLEQLPKGVY
jgi:flagellar biosynthesis protein FliQ